MKLLAIDPGNEQSAYVELTEGKVEGKGIVENNELLDIIYNHRDDWDVMAIEMVASYGMAVGKTVFETCVWIGRFQEALIDHESSMKDDIRLIYRKDVKMHHCQSMRAKDSNIRQALIDKYGKPGTKKAPNEVYNDSQVKMSKDIWSAFAIATYLTETWENN